MIRPPGWGGVAFSEVTDGDIRNDPVARETLARSMGIPSQWAVIRQVHGTEVLRVDSPGEGGTADALWTTETGLPLAVFTADCFGVVLLGETAVGVAHSGWRGAAGGVVSILREEMSRGGHAPERAAVGPGIGPCCFEVGPEVEARFPEHLSTTSWSTPSVDLASVVFTALAGLETWSMKACTRHEDRWFSHRRDATPQRMATLGWLQ